MMNLRSRRTGSPSGRATARVLVGLALAAAAIPGCGDDSSGDDGSDVEPGAGSGTKDDTKSPDGSKIPLTFVISCINTLEEKCTEYLGDPASSDSIKAGVDDTCYQAGEEVSEDRCETGGYVGSCRRLTEYDHTRYWVKTFYYEPVTVARAEERCQGATFEPAP